jgi:antitoxin FitA
MKPIARQRMHNACMTTITIRDVPDMTRDLLAARAKRAGQSMQEYLRRRLVELGERESSEDFWDRVEGSVSDFGSSVTMQEILDALEEGRR